MWVVYIHLIELLASSSAIFSTATQVYNKMYGRKGNLFILRFKRKAIEDGAYFTQLIAY
jgi:hypothetical protein